MELADALVQLRAAVKPGEPELTTQTVQGHPVKPHECEQGWIYDSGEAVRCADCDAADERAWLAQRLAHSGVAPRYLDVTWDDLELVDPLPAIKAASERIGEVL